MSAKQVSAKQAINVEFGAKEASDLERIASKLGISRNTLIRQMGDEVIAADREDRPAFQVRAQADDISQTDVRLLVEGAKLIHAELERSRKRQDQRELAQAERDRVQAERTEAIERRIAALEEQRLQNAKDMEAALRIAAANVLGEYGPAVHEEVREAVSAGIADARAELERRVDIIDRRLRRTEGRWWAAAISTPTLMLALLLGGVALTLLIQLS